MMWACIVAQVTNPTCGVISIMFLQNSTCYSMQAHFVFFIFLGMLHEAAIQKKYALSLAVTQLVPSMARESMRKQSEDARRTPRVWENILQIREWFPVTAGNTVFTWEIYLLVLTAECVDDVRYRVFCSWPSSKALSRVYHPQEMCRLCILSAVTIRQLSMDELCCRKWMLHLLMDMSGGLKMIWL